MDVKKKKEQAPKKKENIQQITTHKYWIGGYLFLAYIACGVFSVSVKSFLKRLALTCLLQKRFLWDAFCFYYFSCWQSGGNAGSKAITH